MKLQGTSSASVDRQPDHYHRRGWSKHWILLWERPVWSAVLALVVYSALAQHHAALWHISSAPYFNYLADAFLHGQLSLRITPPSTHDLSHFNGQLYLYWPPFPAILMMPFVTVFGIQFSDVIFTLGIGALNVGLIALLLRLARDRQIIRLSAIQRGWLV